MSQARRNFLHDLMLLAWDLYTTDLRGPSPRTFRDALKGAWRFMKAQTKARPPKWATMTGPRHVAFGSMVQSPIRRALGSQAYAHTRWAHSGYLTSRLGA